MEELSTSIITAEPGSGTKPRTIDITSSTNFHDGGAETKAKLTGLMTLGEQSKEIFLIERGANLEGKRREEYVKHYFETWLGFKQAGLPVVGVVRFSQEGTLLLSNVKADGSETYGKALANSLRDSKEHVNARNLAIDTTFKQVMKTEYGEIKKKAGELLEIANKNNIALPMDLDPFELLIHPDGSWELITLIESPL